MIYRRLDGGCSSRIMALRPDGNMLIEAKWNVPGETIPRVNKTVVSQAYFERRYGVNPA